VEPVQPAGGRSALLELSGGRPLGAPLGDADRARAAEAPPVVLVSGMMAQPTVWANWVASLQRDGFRVYTVALDGDAARGA
jgi:hypothetical protein